LIGERTDLSNVAKTCLTFRREEWKGQDSKDPQIINLNNNVRRLIRGTATAIRQMEGRKQIWD